MLGLLALWQEDKGALRLAYYSNSAEYKQVATQDDVARIGRGVPVDLEVEVSELQRHNFGPADRSSVDLPKFGPS